MKVSNLLLTTHKEAPQDAELVSHQLMMRAGLIKKLGSGLYSWLPIGLKILRKVEAIIREEMAAIGVQEILMPMVQPADLWKETRRWEKFGPQMLKLKDRHERDFCLGPTHEEVVTDLIRRDLKSYKQLPISVFQIQTKFRDEIRPRFGIMRAREFLMKDAYSFHLDQASLELTYQQMYGAYSQIFTRLGLNFRAVMADTGAIGGSKSHEFHALADSGEDILVISDASDYAANLELAHSHFDHDERVLIPKTEVRVPGITESLAQAQHLGIPPSTLIKTLLVKGSDPKAPIVALLIAASDELNLSHLAKLPEITEPLMMLTLEEAQARTGCLPGFMGPVGLDALMFMDSSLENLQNFALGANRDDTLFINVNWERDLPRPISAQLRLVKEGDLSPDGRGKLKFTRGIEVGHIFQLGDVYSSALDCSVLNENGRKQVVQMGCYGIGVSRIVAAAIEQNHDEKGIVWPRVMAPFQIVIVPINARRHEHVMQAALKVYEELQALRIEVLLEDRNERAGVLFADHELIGIPHRLVISERSLETSVVEYQARGAATHQTIPLPEVLSFIKELLA